MVLPRSISCHTNEAALSDVAATQKYLLSTAKAKGNC